MIGDIVIVQSQHKKKAREIFSVFGFEGQKKCVVCIYGESGTGKSEVAHCLRDILYKNSIRSQIMSLDNYYHTKWSDRNRVRQLQGIKSVGKQEMQWELINGALQTFKSSTDRTTRLKQINKYTDSIEYSVFENSDVDILIVEGLYAGYCKNNLINYRIFLEGNVQNTGKFRRMRQKEPQTPFRLQVLEQEHLSIKGSKDCANLTIEWEI